MGDEGKLFIGGLDYRTDDRSLEDVFSKYGKISEVVVIKDRETQRSRGFGFVTFSNPEDATDAMHAMNGKTVDGRQIRVDLAGQSSGRRGGRGGRGGGDGYGGRSGGYSSGGYSSGGYSSGGYGGGSRDYYSRDRQGGGGGYRSSYRDSYD